LLHQQASPRSRLMLGLVRNSILLDVGHAYRLRDKLSTYTSHTVCWLIDCTRWKLIDCT
jgi:hypothetical protein